MKEQLSALSGAWLYYAGALLLRAFFLMFVAAVIAKRFGVFAPIGYPEAVAWSLAYGLLRGLWMKDEK